MNNYPIFYTFLALMSGAILIATSSYIIDWLRWVLSWGREVYISPITRIRFRKHRISHINLDLRKLDTEIINVFNRSSGYKDRELLCHLHCVFTKDLYDNYKKVRGKYHPDGFYWMASSAYEKIIIIDIEDIDKNKLKELKVAEIIVHNYLHLWMQKYYMSADPQHKEVVWQLFQV